MRKITSKVMIAVMLSSTFVAVAPSPFSSPIYAEQVIHTNLSQPVSIENKGTIELKTIFAVPSPEGQVVTFTLDVINTGNEMIDFNKYWLRIKTTDSKGYPMRWVDQSKNMIYPGQRQTLTFYTVLPNAMALSDVKLRLVKWDMSVSSFERDLGELPINAAIIPTLGKSLSKFIGLTNNQVEASVAFGKREDEEQKETEEEQKYQKVNYILKLMNKGQFAFSLPSYQFILVTNTGVAYPLSVNESKDEGPINHLLPWIEEKIDLTGTVPKTVDLNNVALYVLHPYGGDRGQVFLPVTVFRVFEPVAVEEEPDIDSSIEWGANTELVIKGEKGEESKTKLSVTSIQRFPWDHRDLLSAEVKLINTGEQKVVIPKLQGQFVLGSGYKINAEVILNNEDRTYLYPGSSITYQMLGYISYASSFNNAYIELKENDANDYQKVIKTSKIPHITFTERATQIATMNSNQSYVIGADSALSSLKFGEASTYKSTNGNLVVSRLVVSNLEQRSMKVPNLRAYYKTKQGIIYPAKISQYAENNFPRGSSVVSFSAEFPEEIKQEELQLIVGEEIRDKGIKNGSSYLLSEDSSKVADRIETIDYFPYTIKFSNFFADTTNGFTFKFSKEKSFNSIANLNDRSLIFVFTDIFGDEVNKVTIDLDKWDGNVKLPVPNVDSSGIGANIFTVTIYDVYDGARKALAKQTFYIYNSTTP